jgi:S1-C subfamily serine protease
MRREVRAATLATLAWSLSVATQSSAQQLTPMGQDATLSALRRAVVSIQVETNDGAGRGSGVILTSTGIIVTAAHVLDGATSVNVRTQAGITLPAEGWVHIDPALDLALIKVDASALPFAALGTSLKVDVGSRLIGIGSPLGLDQTVSDGVLSAVRQDTDRTLMQVSIPVSPGSSGGPIATPEGLVLGIVVSGIRGGGAENLNFALPISYAVAALELTGNRTPRPWDGARRMPNRDASRTSESAEVLRRPTGVPSVVNDSVALDWKTLDGVALLDENRPNSELWRYDRQTTYSIVPDQYGRESVERREQTLIMSGDTQFLTSWRKWGEANARTTMQLDGTGSSSYYRGPKASEPNVFEVRDLTIVDSIAEYRVDGKLVDRAWVPSGIIPVAMLGGAVSAFRGSVPTIAYIWTVGVDPNNKIAIASTRIRRLGERPSTMDVPMAREGVACSVRGTVRRRVEVINVEVTSGANTNTLPRLTASPHLPVDETLKCMKVAIR